VKIATSVSFWGPWERNKGGMRIEWACAEGVGQFDLYIDNDGKLRYDSECMSDDFVKELLRQVIDGVGKEESQ
jgi:hypothetical protein